MNKTESLLTIFFASGIIGVISEFLSAAQTPLLILLVLIMIDTVAELAKAIKLKRFNSKVLKKFLRKVVTYTTAIVSVRLLEIGILTIYETTMISQIMAAYLIITEVLSILENITLLGVPIPGNFAFILTGFLRVPGINNIKLGRERDNDISEIDDIIDYQIPVIQDGNTRKLLEIKFEIWKKLIIRIDESQFERNTANEVFYYKTMALIEISFKDMEDRWKEEVPKRCIDLFTSWHDKRVNNWLKKVHEICYSDDLPNDKKEKLIDSIIVVLYQTIIDVQKGITNHIKCNCD